MADIYLSATSGKPGASEVVLVNGSADTGYKLHDWDLGNVAWELHWSGQRGTQGAKLAGATPQHRALVIDLRVTGTDADNLASKQSTIATLTDELRRFGGSFKVRLKNGTQFFYFDVKAGTGQVADYDWAWLHKHTVVHRIEAICAPYVKGDAASALSSGATTLPATFQLSAIAGDAPALAEVAITHSGGTTAPAFALLAWTPRPGTPGSGVAPFGVIEAESGTASGGFASAADANYRGGNGVKGTAPLTAGAGAGVLTFALNPSVMIPDDYAGETIEFEVWARLELANTLSSPTLLTTLEGLDTVFYTREFGSAGKSLLVPSTSAKFRFVRLGSFAIDAKASATGTWTLKLTATSAGTGTFGVDYLILNLTRARAVSPTGKSSDGYPLFLRTTTQRTKTLKPDLSATLNASGGQPFADQGLGGSLLELPPGNVDLLLKLSTNYPDTGEDASGPSAASEQLSHSASVVVTVTPRYQVVRPS